MQPTRFISILMTLGASVALGATATFLPVGSTTVPPGTDVKFDIVLSVETISSFEAADVVIGTAQASDLLFAYATEWDAAFFNITPPTLDPPFYAQGVFVGGNNPTPVGATLRLGTITLKTTGMAEGAYTVMVSSATDSGVSKLSRGDLRDLLNGAATFTIECIAADADCDGDFDLIDFGGVQRCLLGPGQGVSPVCQRYDTDADGDVDMMDAGTLLVGFTGSR